MQPINKRLRIVVVVNPIFAGKGFPLFLTTPVRHDQATLGTATETDGGDHAPPFLTVHLRRKRLELDTIDELPYLRPQPCPQIGGVFCLSQHIDYAFRFLYGLAVIPPPLLV